MKKFWRRSYFWNLLNQTWVIGSDREIHDYEPFGCRWEDGISWCNQPQPYVYEQWWVFVADTVGTGQGSWSYLGGRVNWGSEVAVN